jgi:hypothetical protein
MIMVHGTYSQSLRIDLQIFAQPRSVKSRGSTVITIIIYHCNSFQGATMVPSTTENSSQGGIPVPPYQWDDAPIPNEGDLRLWQDVADQLEKQQTGE